MNIALVIVVALFVIFLLFIAMRLVSNMLKLASFVVMAFVILAFLYGTFIYLDYRGFASDYQENALYVLEDNGDVLQGYFTNAYDGATSSLQNMSLTNISQDLLVFRFSDEYKDGFENKTKSLASKEIYSSLADGSLQIEPERPFTRFAAKYPKIASVLFKVEKGVTDVDTE